jgi:hypothetical protein
MADLAGGWQHLLLLAAIQLKERKKGQLKTKRASYGDPAAGQTET